MPNTNNQGVGKVIDPTKNVLDLVEAAIRRQDDLREAESKYQNDMREAETRRTDQLRTQEIRHAEAMEKMRSEKLDTTAKLLAEAQRETKTDLQVELRGLNQFRWETGGRGVGLNAAAGWVLSFIMAAVAIAALWIKA